MSARVPAHDGRRTSRTRTTCSAAAGTAGLTGALVCGSSMVLAGLGVGTSTTAVGASMAGMDTMDRASTAPRGLLGLLVRVGPGLLIASAVLMAVAVALRRPGAAVPALLAGAVLYAGMYAQPSRTVMDASIAVGYAGWAVLYLWVRKVATVREHGFGPTEVTRRSTMATTLAPESTRACLEVCTECVVACHACADHCTQQADPQMLACIRLCLSCADACLACIPSLSRAANYQQLCQACAGLCDACAAECDRYDDQTMRQCAQACRRAAQACRQIAAA